MGLNFCQQLTASANTISYHTSQINQKIIRICQWMTICQHLKPWLYSPYTRKLFTIVSTKRISFQLVWALAVQNANHGGCSCHWIITIYLQGKGIRLYRKNFNASTTVVITIVNTAGYNGKRELENIHVIQNTKKTQFKKG